MLAALAVAAMTAPAPSDLREAAPTSIAPKAREPTFAPLAPCGAGFVPTCEQAKGFGLCDSANAACDEACVEEVKMACPVTCSLLAEATSGHLAPDAAPSDYGDHLPPAATAAICSTCADHPDLPCCHNHPHEGNGRRRLAQSCADTINDAPAGGVCGGSSQLPSWHPGAHFQLETTLAEARRQGCHTVTGDLIAGGASGDINLPSLFNVLGRIRVGRNDNLTSLTMPNLMYVGRGIDVRWNDNLTSLTINKLEAVSGGDICDTCGDISVYKNDKLASLAMNNLQGVVGRIDVGSNDILASLTMNNLKEVARGIYVRNNDNLASLTMNNLVRVGGYYIYVTNNPNLVSLTMPKLEDMGGQIEVSPKPASCDLGPVYAGRDRYRFC